MSTSRTSTPQTAGAGARSTLTRARVLAEAVALADSEGLGALTMRSLARELGIEAMSLYHHVASKEDLLDGVAEVVVREILDAVGALEPAPEDTPPAEWKHALRRRILTARSVLLRHPWAPSVLETRTGFSPYVVRYHDALVALLHRGGLSYDLVHHAMHALGSRALGFSQELFDPGGPGGDPAAAPEPDDEDLLARLTDEAPHIVAMLAEVAHVDPDSTLGWCDDQAEFEFGLDLILDGLERLAARGSR